MQKPHACCNRLSRFLCNLNTAEAFTFSSFDRVCCYAGQKVSAGGDTLQEMKNMSLEQKPAEDKTPAMGTTMAATPHPVKAETDAAPMAAKSENAHAAATKLDDIGVNSESKDNHPAVAHAVHGVVESAAVPATAHLEDHPVFEPTREVSKLPKHLPLAPLFSCVVCVHCTHLQACLSVPHCHCSTC